MASSSSSSAVNGVPPGFRFHPTDEELLLFYLKKKVSFEKFDLEVIREVDLNKTEPWDLQERCRIGSTPQNDWYFFSHKDRKYPTGSRTNRATTAGFWKATGRDKCIKNSHKKIGMRKTLVFYGGRAPHGQKTDWIMHEYRLEDSDDFQTSEDGWVVCRVFKKKCFFKVSSSGGGGGGGEGSAGQGIEHSLNYAVTASHDQSLALMSSQYMHPNLFQYQHHHNHNSSMYYSHQIHANSNSYPQVQVQDLLTNHRPSGGYGFSAAVPDDSASLVKPYDGGLDVGAGMQNVNEGRDDQGAASEWAVLDGIDGRYAAAAAAGSGTAVAQMTTNQPVGEMDLWGYGK